MATQVSEETRQSLKVASFTAPQNFPKAVDWYGLLAEACRGTRIKLQIPETLLNGKEVFLRTDDEGIVVGDRSSKAVENFVHFSSQKTRNVRKVSSQASIFPQFLSFGPLGVLYTFDTESSMRKGLRVAHTRLQNYIVPKLCEVKKLVVRWRLNGGLKIYRVASTLPLKPRRSLLSMNHVDTQFLASLSHTTECDVQRDKSRHPEISPIVETILRLIYESILSPGEQVEEFYMSLMQGHDGKCYFLHASGLDISEKIEPMLRRSSMDDLYHIHNEEGKLVPNRRQSVMLTVDNSPLNEVAEKMDRFRTLAQKRKEEVAMMQAMDFSGYEDGFMEKCISKAIQRASRDSILRSYFTDESTMSHITSGICELFQGKLSSYKLKCAHKSLSISDEEFFRFIQVFETILRQEGAQEIKIEAVGTYLRSFKKAVLQKQGEEEASVVYTEP